VTRSRQPARRATIYDVAAAAGVSRGTVSRVLNGAGYVSADARKAVERAVASVGYVPNGAARSLARRRTQNVAFIVHEPQMLFFEDPNLAGLLLGANRILGDHGLQEVILVVDNRADIARVSDFLRGGHVDAAALLAARDHDPLIEILSALGLPSVMTGRSSEPACYIPYVDIENRVSACEITRRLLATGRKRVGMITGPSTMAAARERFAGFKEALGEAYDDELVLDTPDWSHRSGVDAMRELQSRDRTIDGVFGGCDAIAVGAMDALRSLGRDVPADVGVIGFDDSAWARRSAPRLSTVRQCPERVGTRMAEILLRQLSGEDLAGYREIDETSVVWRQSA
jgi:DNA-binding LacI/PurR family transcriptional regulator